jgi:HSP20 family protein
MNLTLWDDNFSSQWGSLVDMQRNLDRMFDEAFGASVSSATEDRLFHPPCEIEETDSHYVMDVDLPGVPKKNINIEVRENQLVISGERKSERKTKNASERYYGRFHRVVTLPTGVDPEKIEAQYQDGVLSLAIPKAEAAKARQIKISDGKSSFFSKLLGNRQAEKVEKNDQATAVA